MIKYFGIWLKTHTQILLMEKKPSKTTVSFPVFWLSLLEACMSHGVGGDATLSLDLRKKKPLPRVQTKAHAPALALSSSLHLGILFLCVSQRSTLAPEKSLLLAHLPLGEPAQRPLGRGLRTCSSTPTRGWVKGQIVTLSS
jgi:hypothetical protein